MAPMNFYRWTPKRKEEVVMQIEAGHLHAAGACGLYGLGAEELAQWRRDFAAAGRAGLSVTKRPRRGVALGAGALSLALACGLGGCAPVAWQPPPGAPPQAAAIDDASCRLTARQLEGPVRRGLVWIAIQAAAQQQDYTDCMRARGYVAAAGG